MNPAMMIQPAPRQLVVVIGPHAVTPGMQELAARLAMQGPLRVLDGGNRFNVYPVAVNLRRRTTQLEESLARITLARAFTCYQMHTLLCDTPAAPVPTLILDLLSTFLDENVRLEESRRLLEACLGEIRRLNEQAPVVVSIKPLLPISQERTPLLEMIEAAATQVLAFEKPRPASAVALPLWES